MLHIRLRAMRQNHDMTLRELSATTGLSVSFLSDIERGKTNPSMDTLQRLADYYQQTIAIFVRPKAREASVEEGLQ